MKIFLLDAVLDHATEKTLMHKIVIADTQLEAFKLADSLGVALSAGEWRVRKVIPLPSEPILVTQYLT